MVMGKMRETHTLLLSPVKVSIPVRPFDQSVELHNGQLKKAIITHQLS